MPKTCGMCKYFNKKSSSYGECIAHCPAAWQSYSGGWCSIDDEQAEDCKLFEELVKNNAGMFIVSIDDKFCEWSYRLQLSGDISIHNIIEKLCEALNIEPPEGKIRRGYHGS